MLNRDCRAYEVLKYQKSSSAIPISKSNTLGSAAFVVKRKKNDWGLSKYDEAVQLILPSRYSRVLGSLGVENILSVDPLSTNSPRYMKRELSLTRIA